MRRRSLPFRPLAALLLAALAPAALAQARLTFKLHSTQAYAGEALRASLEISDFREAAVPEWPPLADCEVRSLGQGMDSQYVQIINGRRTETRSRTYEYELIPRDTGTLVIPPIGVEIDGEVRFTPAQRITVKPSNADELFHIDITTGRRRVYLGQRVPVKMTIWVKPARWRNQLLDAAYMLRRIEPINLGPFPPELANPNDVTRARTINGREEWYYAFDFVTDVLISRPGPLSFSDVALGISYPTEGGVRNLRARPEVEPTEALPVPMDGRPDTFAGAVGIYDVETAARPTDVRVGDPIELVIEIFGQGPVETLPPPLLAAHAELNARFRVPDETLPGETQDGRRRFTVTIRARDERVTEIPPLEYPYFDPDAERFVIARSAPIPLTVRPAAEVETPDLTPRNGPPDPAGPAALEALDGLLDIETDEARLLGAAYAPRPRLIDAVLFVPPAAFVLTWVGLTLLQRHVGDPARRRRAGAGRVARRRIQRARRLAPQALAAELAAALTNYLADRTDQPPGRLVGEAAMALLLERGVDPTVVGQWSEMMARCDEASFAGGTAVDGTGLHRAALACLRALEHEKL